MTKKIPNPGSHQARKLGCICPVLDNEFGNVEATGGMFVIAKGCPVHKWDWKVNNREEERKGET